MKKIKRSCVNVWLVCICCLLLGGGVCAEKNPFQYCNSNTKNVKRILGSVSGKGWDFCTPTYKKDFKMQVTSSPKNIAEVKTYSLYQKDSIEPGYYKGFEVIPKKSGTVKIHTKITIDNKKYEKTFTYTYYLEKYENPFSSFKINGKNYTSRLNKFNKNPSYNGRKNPYMKWSLIPSGKLQYKMKKNYQITHISATTTGIQQGTKELKNGSVIPENCNTIYISYRNTKTDTFGGISIRIN